LGILSRLGDWLINHKRLSRFQAGFTKDRRTTDNIFVIKAAIDKYLRFKRGRLYWCFVNLEKAFDPIDRETLWYKLRRKGISDKMVECFRRMYDGIKFCVKCGEDVMTDFIEQERGVRQGCSLSPYLFNTFIDDMIYQ
jgi:hypothetical protein